MTHELKICSVYLYAIKQGLKTFEIRSTDDRTFVPGDKLHLRVWDQKDGYSGEQITVDVTYITGFAQPQNQVVMSIVPTNDKKYSLDKVNESSKLAEVNEPMKNQTNDGKTEAEVLLGEIHKSIVDRMGFWNTTASGDSFSNRVVFMAMMEVANAINAVLVCRKVEAPQKPVETKAERIARLAVVRYKADELLNQNRLSNVPTDPAQRERRAVTLALNEAAVIEANAALNATMSSVE